MARRKDRTAGIRANVAWLLLVVGFAVAAWGLSMGFTRHGPGGVSHRNVEAYVRVAVGIALVLSSLVLATLAAPRLSRFERGWWGVAIWVAVFVGAFSPLFVLAEAMSTFSGGDPSAGLSWGIELMTKAAIAAALVASVVAVFWIKVTVSRSRASRNRGTQTLRS